MAALWLDLLGLIFFFFYVSQWQLSGCVMLANDSYLVPMVRLARIRPAVQCLCL